MLSFHAIFIDISVFIHKNRRFITNNHSQQYKNFTGTLKTEEIQKIAELHVSSRVLFQMPLRNAAVNGCMDARLGISDKISNCQTCK